MEVLLHEEADSQVIVGLPRGFQADALLVVVHGFLVDPDGVISVPQVLVGEMVLSD